MKKQKGYLDIEDFLMFLVCGWTVIVCTALVYFMVTNSIYKAHKRHQDAMYQSVDGYLNTPEKVLVEAYQKKLSAFDTEFSYGSTNFWGTLEARRKLTPYEREDLPFCDLLTVLDQVENRIGDEGTMSKLWVDMGYEPLSISCAESYTTNVPVIADTVVDTTEEEGYIVSTESEQRDQVIEASVTLGGESLLSPDKVRELSVSAKECNRTKNKLLELTEGGRYLDTSDYQEVTKLVLDCENLKLQNELNL